MNIIRIFFFNNDDLFLPIIIIRKNFLHFFYLLVREGRSRVAFQALEGFLVVGCIKIVVTAIKLGLLLPNFQ